MMIDGKHIAQQIEEELAKEVSAISGRKPCLAVVLVGDYPPSKIYVNRKTEKCKQVGILPLKKEFPKTISEKELLEEINLLNKDETVDGILVQLPLPPAINSFSVCLAIDPKKDVDGLHPLNMGKLLLGEKETFVPCTPLGIQELLFRFGEPLTGKHVVIIGRSNIVGKPLALLLMQKGERGSATVTVANSQTQNLKQLCQTADVLVVATGKPCWIGKEYIRKGAIVIDVGINKIESLESKKGYKIVGDVNFEEVFPLCKAITPVPGGVGPMTIAMLLKNTLHAFQRKIKGRPF